MSRYEVQCKCTAEITARKKTSWWQVTLWDTARLPVTALYTEMPYKVHFNDNSNTAGRGKFLQLPELGMQTSGSVQRLGAQSTKEQRAYTQMPRNFCSQQQGLILSSASSRQMSTLTLNWDIFQFFTVGQMRFRYEKKKKKDRKWSLRYLNWWNKSNEQSTPKSPGNRNSKQREIHMSSPHNTVFTMSFSSRFGYSQNASGRNSIQSWLYRESAPHR